VQQHGSEFDDPGNDDQYAGLKQGDALRNIDVRYVGRLRHAYSWHGRDQHDDSRNDNSIRRCWRQHDAVDLRRNEGTV
jgi:hypothetical protein